MADEQPQVGDRVIVQGNKEGVRQHICARPLAHDFEKPPGGLHAAISLSIHARVRRARTPPFTHHLCPATPGRSPALAIRDPRSNIVPTSLTPTPCSSTHMPPSRYSAPRSQVIRYTGETQFKEGDWVGVELAKALGKNDGSVQGVVYFECDQEFGLFVRPNNVAVSVYEAMHGDSDVGRPHSQCMACMCPPCPPCPPCCACLYNAAGNSRDAYPRAKFIVRHPRFACLALSTPLPFPRSCPFHSLALSIPSHSPFPRRRPPTRPTLDLPPS